MSLRITPDVLYRNSLTYIQKGLKRLEEAQVPLLTGKKINRPSDDPFNTIRVLKLREEREVLDDHIENIDNIDSLQKASASALQSLSELLAQAKSIAIQGASSGVNQTDRETLANHIDQILTEAVSLADTHFGGRYLFGGTMTTNPPYIYNGSDTVTYNGNDGVAYGWISTGTKMALNIPGSEIFQKRDRGPTIFEGTTGAAPGSGTDSGTGNATLSVIHDTTTYAGGSGVAAGTGSAAGDTIIGQAGAHTLTITVGPLGQTGTVALDGGAAAAFDITTLPDPANFLLTNASGDQVYLDLTALTPGFSGTVNITSTGFLSLDGGTTTTPIDFSTNQIVYDPSTDTVTNVNSSGIIRTGDEYLTYSGTFDLFQNLIAIRDDLLNTRGLTTAEQIDSISARIPELDDVHEDVLSSLAEFGGRSLRLEMTKNRLNDFHLELTTLIAEIEEADLTEAIMNFDMATYGLQLAQDITKMVLQSSMKGPF